MRKLILLGLLGRAVFLGNFISAENFVSTFTNSTTYVNSASLFPGFLFVNIGNNQNLYGFSMLSSSHTCQEFSFFRCLNFTCNSPAGRTVLLTGIISGLTGSFSSSYLLEQGYMYGIAFSTGNFLTTCDSKQVNVSNGIGLKQDGGLVYIGTVYSNGFDAINRIRIRSLLYSGSNPLLPDVDYGEVFLNGNKIYDLDGNDYYINWSGGGNYSTYLNSLTITGQYQQISTVVQGLTTLNYTGLQFNIGTNYSPYVSGGVFYVPNASEFTGEFDYLEPLQVSGNVVNYSGSLVGGFFDNINKLVFSNLYIRVYIFVGIIVIFMIGKIIKRLSRMR